jgi:malonyl-CoA decarboxylase
MAPNTSFFSDLLASIAERGHALLDPKRSRPAGGEDIVNLCEALISERGEASGVALAQEILRSYAELDDDGRTIFFDALTNRFGPDLDRIDAAIARFTDARGNVSAAAINEASEARRQELIRRLNLAPEGTACLVRMRSDLLTRMGEVQGLELVDRDFEHLFASWFNRGFLVLKRIDWSSPAVILERIIRYEAVHAIRDWDDLRRRIDPPDRRCFAFFHPSLVDDPLIFVEVALTDAMPDAIAPILADSRTAISPGRATTAVFYSISNCQDGLRGITFGNFLIKQVVEDLTREFAGIKTFVTLSPIPGLRRWLDDARADAADELNLTVDQRKALAILDHDQWARKGDVARRLKALVLPIAAHYLMRAKSMRGAPLDPVARFHLGNGARLERINWLADPSPKGLADSAGIMVNYSYVLKDIERNHEAFAHKGAIAASSAVRGLLRSDNQPLENAVAR